MTQPINPSGAGQAITLNLAAPQAQQQPAQSQPAQPPQTQNGGINLSLNKQGGISLNLSPNPQQAGQAQQPSQNAPSKPQQGQMFNLQLPGGASANTPGSPPTGATPQPQPGQGITLQLPTGANGVGAGAQGTGQQPALGGINLNLGGAGATGAPGGGRFAPISAQKPAETSRFAPISAQKPAEKSRFESIDKPAGASASSSKNSPISIDLSQLSGSAKSDNNESSEGRFQSI